ncbi:MAG TPA: rhodanese-like domain-containing protein [Chloroflexaceae bacterium]|nr:rhodanese-like domain-containing protein [Chloroflexaceae bacterium]
MSARRLSALLAALAALVLALAACGQATQAPPAAEPAPVAVQEAAPVAPATTDVKLVVGDYLAGMPEGFNAITKVEGLTELMASGDPLIVDVREPAEYAEGHIPGSVNIPIRTLAQNLDKIPTDRPVVLTCASGLRASFATTALQLLGYTNARDFFPSFKGWTAANLEVSTEATEAAVVGAPEVDPTVLAEVDAFLAGLPEGFYSVGKVEALKEMMDAGNVTVVDVREASEFAEGRIPGAINIPLRTLGQNLDQIPTDQPVVLSCASGLRCSLATPALHIAGLTNVRTFPPSFKGWSAAEMAIEK